VPSLRGKLCPAQAIAPVMLPNGTAWDHLMFTARLFRVPANERWRRVQTLLEPFDLNDARHVRAEHLSKGLRRRLSIAMGLVHRPRVLFLDEPTSGLDVQSTRTIHHQIQALSAERATVFLSTHQIEHANQLCDPVAIINHGRSAAIDTPERLKEAFRRVQSIEVALAPADSTHGTTLEALPGVSKAVKHGDKWRLYTEDPSALLLRVMHVAAGRGVRVVSLNTVGPSLEDVFLATTSGEVGMDRDYTQGDDHAEGEPRGGP
jgi:ABC-2 type transport system ATP-binding protein